jgi:hypothetical protein
VWWLATPPSFRFAWGPLFTLFAIPIGWSLWHLARGTTPAGVTWRRLSVAGLAVPIIAVLAVGFSIRLDWSSIDVEKRGWGVAFAVAEIPEAEVKMILLPSGLEITVPVITDQCWSAYPLCTPQAAEGLRLRGASLSEGFAH